jgi:ribosomal protein S18 acetylase RimI-like enzyme
MAIRRLRVEDVEACARIVAGDPLWRRYRVGLPQARRTIRQALAAARRRGRVARDAGEFAVAGSGGQVVGFIWFRLDGTFHHSGYVRWIGVAPEAQGRGVGRRLMQYAEDRIFKAGPNVFLMVSDFNKQAQRFYEALGYRLVGKVPDYIVPGIGEHVYRKTRGPIAARRGG